MGTKAEVEEAEGLYLECVLQAAEVQLMEGIQRSAELRRSWDQQVRQVLGKRTYPVSKSMM